MTLSLLVTCACVSCAMRNSATMLVRYGFVRVIEASVL